LAASSPTWSSASKSTGNDSNLTTVASVSVDENAVTTAIDDSSTLTDLFYTF
jgi:hypothetical protein